MSSDLDAVLDTLLDLLESARALPMSASCVVNRDEMLGLVEDVRALLPGELAEAKQVLQDRAAVVAQGHAEAERIVARARVEQDRLVEATAVWQRAQAEADRLLAEVHAEAEAMRVETDDYVDAKLANFEVVLTKTLTAVQRGRTRLSGEPTGLADAAPDRSDEVVPG